MGHADARRMYRRIKGGEEMAEEGQERVIS